MNVTEIYGALNDKNDPDYKRRNKHADLYYETRRNSKKEPWIKKVAANIGMNEKAISKIFDHVFIKEHEIYGELKRFYSSYDMAESFRRLQEGKNIQPHDLILIKHERLEAELMNRYGYNQSKAHTLASRKYNYAAALTAWHKEQDLNRKSRTSGDQRGKSHL